jgi:hypothetical protein
MDRLMAALGMTGAISWCLALMLGPLLTLFPPYTEATWWLWPALRVAWAFGSALALSLGMAWDAPGGALRRFAVLGLVTGLVTLVLNPNPLLDLVRGPYVGPGHLAGVELSRGVLHSRPTGGPSPTIEGDLTWIGLDRVTVRIRPIGIQANRVEDALATCPDGVGRLVALRHLDVVVALECTPPPPGR